MSMSMSVCVCVCERDFVANKYTHCTNSPAVKFMQIKLSK